MVGHSEGTDDLDLMWLCRIRIVVARLGEMDVLRWWNTDGQLSSFGAKVMSRGLPRTHYFAQARSVFAVAAHRSAQVFNPPNCATLWHLTDSVEDEFDARWESWLDDAGNWKPFFEEVARIQSGPVAGVLQALGLVTDEEVDELSRQLRRSATQSSVLLPNAFTRDRRSIAQLALGHGLSGIGDLAVPYARLDAQ